MALDFSEFPSPFRLGENLAQPPYSVTPVTPADGDDMTWAEGYDDAPLTYAALVATVYRLQNEMHGLAAQVVEAKAEVAELRKRVNEWEGD
jgi:hypothetical protein